MISMRIEQVNRADAFRYMGLRGEPDPAVLAETDRCEKELLEAARPRYVLRVFDLIRSEGELRLDGCDFSLEGESIARHLDGCSKAAVIAATLSAQTDRFLKKAMLGDGLKGLISDALASACVEQVIEKARAEVIELTGLHCTWCFAAGYGDFPLETAGKLIQCVDGERRIGLSVTASGMLTPQKSIAAVAGLSEKPLPAANKSCSDCNMRGRCQFRKNGDHCQ